jgi:hypothetical protein
MAMQLVSNAIDDRGEVEDITELEGRWPMEQFLDCNLPGRLDADRSI